MKTKRDEYNIIVNKGITIDDRVYEFSEIKEILKRHKIEEDKKYHKCYRCGNRYLENNKFNMVVNNLEQRILTPYASGYATGYATTPYITGFKILSKCGQGKEIGLCDDCIEELVNWLNGVKQKS